MIWVECIRESGRSRGEGEEEKKLLDGEKNMEGEEERKKGPSVHLAKCLSSAEMS